MPPRRRTQEPTGGQNPMTREEMAEMIVQQISAAIPTIVAQVRAGPSTGDGGGSGATGQGDGTHQEGSAVKPAGCSYKAFMGCKPKEFYGTEGTIKALQWIDEVEAILGISKCAEGDKVLYVTHSLKGEALEWWNSIIQARGRAEATQMPWTDFVKLLTEKYCPLNEMEKLQTEFLSLSMEGSKIMEYTRRFNALARLMPSLVTPESQKINRYIWGLDSRIRRLVKASQPATMRSAMELAAVITDDCIRTGEYDEDRSGGKRKTEEYEHGRIENKRKGRRDQEERREQDPPKMAKAYLGTSPMCERCKRHHQGECRIPVCPNCKKIGHVLRDCRAPKSGKCFECGSTGHYRNNCPKLKRVEEGSRGAQGRAFVMDGAQARREPDVVTGTFLLNQHFASVLFDTGASGSFISTTFRSLIEKEPTKLSAKI